MEEFKVGDVVRLKSGGPQMTIEVTPVVIDNYGVEKKLEDSAKCTWFEKDTLKYNVFKLATLTHAE